MNDIQPIALPGVDPRRPLVIAGPCSAETEEQVIETARLLAAEGFRIYRALQLLGKHARAAGELAIYVQRHMNAARGLIDLVELDFVTLFVHKDGAAHQRRILKASRLNLNIRSRPSHQSKR